MKISFKKGLSFGLTSGVVTTLGLIIGLASTTDSKSIIVAGLLTIAIADSLSDAMGIHISEESSGEKTSKEVWEATFATLFGKIVFTSSFILPFIFFDITPAIIISLLWGFLLIIFISLLIAKKQNLQPFKVIWEHLAILVLVIILTHFVGDVISLIFN